MSDPSSTSINEEESLLGTNVYSSDSNNIEGYNVDQLIDKAGRFGKFQWLLILYILVTTSGVNFYITNLPYLELVPALKCQYTGETDFKDCSDK